MVLLVAEAGPIVSPFERRHFVSHRQSGIGHRPLEALFQVDQSVTANFWERIEILLRTKAHTENDISQIPAIKSNSFQTEMERPFVLSVQ